MNKQKLGGEKRWEKVGKKERSKQMKKVRGIVDFLKIKLPVKPQDIKLETLKEIANSTKKGLEAAILLSLADKKSRTKKEIEQLVEKITLTAAVEFHRREGNLEVSDDFDWFTNWTAKQNKMVCPNCENKWMIKKEEKGKCPKCGIDLIKLAEEMFPKLKKRR